MWQIYLYLFLFLVLKYFVNFLVCLKEKKKKNNGCGYLYASVRIDGSYFYALYYFQRKLIDTFDRQLYSLYENLFELKNYSKIDFFLMPQYRILFLIPIPSFRYSQGIEIQHDYKSDFIVF